MAEEKRARILSFLPPERYQASPALLQLRADYDIISLPEFAENPDDHFDEIKVVIVTTLTGSPQTLENDWLRKMPNLRAVTSFSTGLDHVNLPLLKELGVRVARAAGVSGDSTADHGVGLMIAIARRLPELTEAARGYKEGAALDPAKNRACRGRDVTGAMLGIIGMGTVGFEVAKRVQGFRMKVLYHNRKRRSHEDEEAVNATYCPTLKDMLPDVDFLIVAAPLTDATRNMMSKEQFQMMKPTAFVINIARGPLVNTDDLVEALTNKVIAGAALDVTNPEPLPDHHPLLHMPNVIVTPHVGMNTVEGIARLGAVLAENTRAAMEDLPMPGEYRL